MEKIKLSRLIVYVFIISWIGVIPSVLISHKVMLPNWVKFLNVLMILGPISGAVLFVYKSGGKKGLKSFFARFLRFKTSLSIILLTLLVPMLLPFLGAYFGLMLEDTAWPSQFTTSSILQNAVITFLAYFFVNTEEFVWRGIVFDQLYEKYGYLKACLILIPIWGVFHFPLFLYAGGHLAGYGVLDFAFLLIPSTFVLGWIYIQTNRSLFYVHIHHQLINGVGQAFPLFPVFIGGLLAPVRVVCALYTIVAIGIIVYSQVKK